MTMNKVLYINKPKGMTSFDLCYKLRKVFNTRSIGHTGTLDPNATGVMVILLNKACKANQFLVHDTKEYIAKVEFGYETDTLDIDGQIIKEEAFIAPTTQETYLKVFKEFLGKIEQIPPMTSAIKVNGKKLVDYQREGKEVEIPKREVEIYNLELIDFDEKGFTFKALVSSGTYIRTLMKDICLKLNCLSTLVELTRTQVGAINLEQCDDFEEVLKGNYHLYSLYESLAHLYEVVEVEDVKWIMNGKHLHLNTDANQVLICHDKEVLAIYERYHNDEFKSVRGLF